MVLKLNYWSLSSSVSNANKLANELDQYCDELTKKVQNKIYSVEGGSSAALNNASYYINSKLKQLRQKESNVRTFARNVDNLISTAKRVDQDVARTIENRQKELFKKNPDLKPPEYKAKTTKFLCNLKDVPIIGSIIKGGEEIVGAVETLKKDIKYWYKCEGGKELVGLGLSIVGAVAAIAVFAGAMAISGGTLAVIAGIAGAVSAVIGLVNAATNVYTSARAYNEALGGEPGVAKIYAGQDTFSDLLRERNFHDKKLNRGSMITATTVDIVDSVCAVVTFVTGTVKLVKEVKKINLVKKFNDMGRSRNSMGQYTSGKVSFRNGIKSVMMKANSKETLKDIILGDLNVKDFKRFNLLARDDQASAIKSFAKACSGIIGDLDKINEGDMTFTEFLFHRAVKGVDQAIFGRQELKTKEGKRKYYDTKFTTIAKLARKPFEFVGPGKLLNDKFGKNFIENSFGLKDGTWKDVADIITNISDIVDVVKKSNITINISKFKSAAQFSGSNSSLTMNIKPDYMPKNTVAYIKPTYVSTSTSNQLSANHTIIEAMIPNNLMSSSGTIVPNIPLSGHFIMPKINFGVSINTSMPYLNIA